MDDAFSQWLEKFKIGYDDSISHKVQERNINKKIETIKEKVSKIIDPKLRSLLERDCEELVITCENKAWKSALVLSGSIIEAILLNEVKKDIIRVESAYIKINPKNKRSVDEWDLHELISVCENIGILSKEDDGLLNAIKNYRNLIHPGKEVREIKMKPTEEVAEIGKFLVFHLLRKFYDDQH